MKTSLWVVVVVLVGIVGLLVGYSSGGGDDGRGAAVPARGEPAQLAAAVAGLQAEVALLRQELQGRGAVAPAGNRAAPAQPSPAAAKAPAPVVQPAAANAAAGGYGGGSPPPPAKPSGGHPTAGY